MKIEHKRIKVGSRIKLKEDIEMFNCTYTKGHEFKVVSESERGFDLEDDDGNKMLECLFIHDKLELIDVENKSHNKPQSLFLPIHGAELAWYFGKNIGKSRPQCGFF